MNSKRQQMVVKTIEYNKAKKNNDTSLHIAEMVHQ